MTARTQAPKVDLDATRAQLERVGLYRAAEQLEVLVGEAVRDEVPPHSFLDKLPVKELGRYERELHSFLNSKHSDVLAELRNPKTKPAKKDGQPYHEGLDKALEAFDKTIVVEKKQ